MFYVGKGGGGRHGNSRVFSHFNEADDPAKNSRKVQTIREIWASGRDVEWQIVRRSLPSPEVAFSIEAAIIDTLMLSPNGRPDNDIDGHDKTEKGWRSQAEILTIAAPDVRPQFPGPVFIFPIHEALREHPLRDTDWKTAVYESTRRAWALGKSLLNKRNCRAVGIVGNISFGAYSIDRWECNSHRIDQLKTGKTRKTALWEFIKGDEGSAAELLHKNWQHILTPEAKYRTRSGGVIVVEFGGETPSVQYLRPNRGVWQPLCREGPNLSMAPLTLL